MVAAAQMQAYGGENY